MSSCGRCKYRSDVQPSKTDVFVYENASELLLGKCQFNHLAYSPTQSILSLLLSCSVSADHPSVKAASDASVIHEESPWKNVVAADHLQM